MWEQVYALIILIIFTSTVLPIDPLDRKPHWVKYNQDTNELPESAIFGGYGSEPLFIGRAPHRGSLTPGKFMPSGHETIISWGGFTHVKYDFEILCGLDYQWIPTTTDNIPDEAVVGGYMEDTHEPLYVGRSHFFGQIIPGKVAKSQGAIYLAHNTEIKLRHFEILTAGDNRKPKITGSPCEVATIRQNVSISCSILGGEPIPTINWQYKAKADSTFVSVLGSDSMLNISNVNMTDAGTYKCVATNDVGDDNHDTELIVQDSSKISDSISALHWVPFNPDTDEVPADAIVGGYQNETLYIARALHNESLTYGLYVRSINKAYVTLSFDAHSKNVFQILCGRNYEWVPMTTDNIPNEAFVGGYIGDSLEAEYIGRTNYSGYVIPGKVTVSHGMIHFAYEGRTAAVKDLEILVSPKKESPIINGKASKTVIRGQSVDIECKVFDSVPTPIISWQFKPKRESSFMSIPRSDSVLHISRAEEPYEGIYKCVANYDVENHVYVTELIVKIPNAKGNPLWVLFNPDTDELPADAIVGGYQNETLYITRAPHEGSMSPGTYVSSEHKAYITWGNDTHPENNFEILRGDNYIWVPTTADHIPDRAFVGGYIETTNELLYICKANYSGHVIPGKVAVSQGVCYIAYGGKTVPVRNFEILVVPERRVPKITGKERVTVEKGQSANIECKVLEGVPKPTITWQFKGKHDTSFMSIPRFDNVLHIPGVEELHAGIYKCVAINEMGYSRHLTELIVRKIVDDYGIIYNVDLLKHMQGPVSELKCDSEDPAGTITWFENGVSTETKGETYLLENVNVSFEGNNYTCRVKNYNAPSYVHTFVLTVSQLQFSVQQRDPIFLDLTGREGYGLNCDFDAKATPNISWTLNGELVENQTSSQLTFVGNWGTYACKVSTIHGTIQRSFHVTSSKCIIPREAEYVNTTPIILTSTASWPMSDYTTDYLKVEPGETLIFDCENETNHFQMFPLRRKIKAHCLKEDQFIVKDKSFKVTDLLCVHEVQAGVVKKQEKCWTNTSELLGVGYGFSEIYEVCFDTANNIPLYSHAKISKSISGDDVTYKWHKYRALDAHRDPYTCDNATSTCCYSKAQLVTTREVTAGPPQRTTFIDPFNAVPHWRPCGMTESPWEIMDNAIRTLTKYNLEYNVWSGTYMPQDINGTVIPRYLWKVVEKSLAMVYINGPSPTREDILCTDIFGYRMNTYLCKIEEFLQVLGLEATSVGKASPGEALHNADALLLF